MIDLLHVVWLTVGLLVGSLHAATLWRGSHAHSHWAPALGLLRLGCISGALVIAALNGGIVATALGWGIGFFAVATACVTHRDPSAHASPKISSNNETI